MPFFWKPGENTRIKIPAEHMKAAVIEVTDNGKSVQAAAKEYGVDRKTLGRYVEKVLNGNETTFQPNHVSNQVFSCQQEDILKTYLIQSSKLNFGLTPLTTRKFAFQYAIANNISTPKYWTEHKMASYAWLTGFMHRHANLSLRSPQATSLGRATAFNKTTVEEFFSNLREVFSKHLYGPEAIFNVDETGFTTVHQPGKVISMKGEKQVSKMTSAERGTLVTVCCAVSAVGMAVPPFFVFPRVRVSDQMKIGAPPGSLAAAHPSGWMTGDNFERYLEHFIKFTRCSVDNKVLIVLDNHDSHVTPKGLPLCKDNGVTLVTLPPHTSHRLQPLDRTVFRPFKAYYNVAADDFMHANPGVPINIYNIPGLVGVAYGKAFTPENIQKGFACTGIWPFNSQIFSDSDFLGASVTDRPDPTHQVQAQVESSSPSVASASVSPSGTSSVPLGVGLSPEEIRPFPRAGPRKGRGGRRPGKSRILTSTPVKASIENDRAARLERKRKKSIPAAKTTKCRLQMNASSSDEEEVTSAIGSETDASISEYSDEVAKDPIFKVNDYALVKFATKKTICYYVGKIVKRYNNFEFNVQFLRKINTELDLFVFPDHDDIADVVIDDMMQLPKPVEIPGTERVTSKLKFKFDFSRFNVR